MIDVTSVEVTDLDRYRLQISFTDGSSSQIDLEDRLRDRDASLPAAL
jgi:hypothetical protein